MLRSERSIRVWRVAHSEAQHDGFPIGPYRWDQRETLEAEMISKHRYSLRHLPPGRDARFGRRMTEFERAGFDSLSALREWFEGSLPLLAANGFAMWVYEVPTEHVAVGSWGQVIFLAEAAELISAGPLVGRCETWHTLTRAAKS